MIIGKLKIEIIKAKWTHGFFDIVISWKVKNDKN